MIIFTSIKDYFYVTVNNTFYLIQYASHLSIDMMSNNKELHISVLFCYNMFVSIFWQIANELTQTQGKVAATKDKVKDLNEKLEPVEVIVALYMQWH